MSRACGGALFPRAVLSVMRCFLLPLPRPPLVSLSITECHKHFRQAESWSGWHPASLICLSLLNVGRGGVHILPSK